MKRLFTLALGLGAGLLVGAYVVRQLDAAQQAVAPTNLAGQAGRAAGGLTEKLKAAAAEGRIAAAEREAELRASYPVPTIRQALGG
ncbi:MAG: hypothetical protein JJT89_02915 [Nitriliruptoraceae bacterium]|nr:hypothetical protein [Nitriliruptoraceae bacterium]